MYNKTSKAELERMYKKNELTLSTCENTQEVRSWKDFLKLPFPTQQLYRKRWDEYYENVLSSKAYINFREQKEAFKNNNMARVKEIATQAREMLEKRELEITKPTCLNPYEIENDGMVRQYQYLIKRKRELSDQMDFNDNSFSEIFQ
jgi:hypothetical protein